MIGAPHRQQPRGCQVHRQAQACGRAANAPQPDTAHVRFGEVIIDLAAKRVTRRLRPWEEPTFAGHDAGIRLTPTEWRLLEVLLRSPGRLMSRQRLLAEAWGPGYSRATGNLRLYVSQLRRKLEPDPAHPRWLLTVPGTGYLYQPDQS